MPLVTKVLVKMKITVYVTKVDIQESKVNALTRWELPSEIQWITQFIQHQKVWNVFIWYGSQKLPSKHVHCTLSLPSKNQVNASTKNYVRCILKWKLPSRYQLSIENSSGMTVKTCHPKTVQCTLRLPSKSSKCINWDLWSMAY